ncbi:uncharacterized protein PHALS_09951 [Plasmopara halstedii]|uniref:Uncharacterized protein n=1 Tax=Plasmopara halstedii TaxID=4781 RepID=A0A0N7L4V3_PLAHL|nr:uncharacterized protein PHALS_09951 [Plasmopara halstedii]CEG39715.1 hypothetical protein PHALS_09951 [Plasmopara halstedii]|eukprot:XP_024576084.1 hypothetical protein PHALS_09951 [Plasmopara halstedii]
MSGPQELLPPWLSNHHVDKAPTPPEHIHLSPWNDGFTPSGCNECPGKIVRDFPRDHAGAFAVYDAAVSKQTADLLYTSAVKDRVWGVYVPVSQLQLKKSSKKMLKLKVDESEDPEANHQALARRAVQEFLVQKDANQCVSKNDWRRTHGVAVWVIASDCDDKTEYHLDYAEQVRFETNVIFPPIYGATLHVSPLRSDSEIENLDKGDGTKVFKGGDFYVNMKGLVHYDTYGYKARKRSNRPSTDDMEILSKSEPGWKRISYRYRRGILCDGEFPHFSGRVRELPTTMSSSGEHLPVKRVVVGFNLIPKEIGSCVSKFPEHSSYFNRYVRLSQAAVKHTKLLSTLSDSGGWTLESIRSNPKQAAFIKLLARMMREKRQQEAEAQAQECKKSSQSQAKAQAK